MASFPFCSNARLLSMNDPESLSVATRPRKNGSGDFRVTVTVCGSTTLTASMFEYCAAQADSFASR